ncbi:helix-turn-helix domain-containing protein [Salinivibrio sp. ES.052]|uniref:helix-turn-helix domain-containing protein n=1 Tax=Salinivibrio sp. ES.052 TaxID=1882823 RepID=UPI00092A820B|nr:helix-turn-helix domain-containing protein [Salinivibrio sp. ES.052]SIN77045.1 transcriptional regulator, AraC family [Salinivibrio sp. ES.052]
MNTKRYIPHVQLSANQFCRAIEISSEQEGPFLLPHRHDYWELVWCQEDRGTQSIDFVEYENRSNRFFTIAPGQVHLSKFMGNNVRLLLFSPEFVGADRRSNQLISTIFSTYGDRSPYIDCDKQAIKYLDPLFTMLKEECEYSEKPCDWDLMESLTNGFLRYLSRYAKASTKGSEQRDTRVRKLMELIELHFKEERKCEFYASKLSLTSKRLNEVVKNERGKTVTQLIHGRIMLEASRDLAFSTKTIKTIALEMGFEDPAYFSHFYRKQMNESPKQFRLRCSDSAAL